MPLFILNGEAMTDDAARRPTTASETSDFFKVFLLLTVRMYQTKSGCMNSSRDRAKYDFSFEINSLVNF